MKRLSRDQGEQEVLVHGPHENPRHIGGLMRVAAKQGARDALSRRGRTGQLGHRVNCLSDASSILDSAGRSASKPRRRFHAGTGAASIAAASCDMTHRYW